MARVTSADRGGQPRRAVVPRPSARPANVVATSRVGRERAAWAATTRPAAGRRQSRLALIAQVGSARRAPATATMEAERGQAHPLPADLVGELAEEEERQHVADHVGGVHQREDDL